MELKKNDDRKIIVSLTSHPARMAYVDRTIKTLLIQNHRADYIILWLAKEQFPNGENELPSQLLELKNYGLSIRWCDDLKPHKKYFYTMQEFPEDIIITVDDDVYYSPRLIESLYESHKKNPDAIICTRANRMRRDENGHFRYSDFMVDYRGMFEIPLSDMLPTGVGGVLYPPGILPKETFNKSNISELCLYQDDIWLKAMEVISDVPTVICGEQLPLDVITEIQDMGLFSVNQHGGNDEAFSKVTEYIDGLLGEKGGFQKAIFESKYSINSYMSKSNTSEGNLKEDFEKLFGTVDLYVYGAGHGARLVIETLKYAGNHVVPKAFIVSSKDGNPSELFGRPVLTLSDIFCPNDNYLIVVSPAEKHHENIISSLKERGWNNIIPIHDEWMGELIWSDKRRINAENNILFDFLKQGNEYIVNN